MGCGRATLLLGCRRGEVQVGCGTTPIGGWVVFAVRLVESEIWRERGPEWRRGLLGGATSGIAETGSFCVGHGWVILPGKLDVP